jgi:hypothetical protein
MKVYVFYINEAKIKAKDKADEYPGINWTYKSSVDASYSIYAMTNIKGYAKWFMTTRNMKLFEMKTFKMDTEKWEELQNMYPDAVYEQKTFQTKGPDNDDESICAELIEVKALATTTEHDVVYDKGLEYVHAGLDKLTECIEGFGSDPYELVNNFIDIFNDEIKDALTNLGFVDMLAEYQYCDNYYDWYSSMPLFASTVDTLALYCNIFANTYSNKKGMKAIESL